MIASSTGGATTPDSSNNLFACSSATRNASADDSARSGTRSRSLRMIGVVVIRASFPASVMFVNQFEVSNQLLDLGVLQVVLRPQVRLQSRELSAIGVAAHGVEIDDVNLKGGGERSKRSLIGNLTDSPLNARHACCIDA